MKATKKTSSTLSKKRILRAVASSTAIETGQSINSIEAKLTAKTSKFEHLSLAV